MFTRITSGLLILHRFRKICCNSSIFVLQRELKQGYLLISNDNILQMVLPTKPKQEGQFHIIAKEYGSHKY